MTDYIALIHKEPESGYGIDFPDFPGAMEVADTLEEAREKASSLLALCLEIWQEEGHPIPEPSSLDTIMQDPLHKDGVALVVPAPKLKSRAVRFNMTMVEDLLTKVDEAAKRAGMSRSAFFARAAQRELATL